MQRAADFSVALTMHPVAACDLCGSARFASELVAPDLVERMVAGDHRYVRCADCGLCFLDPRPAPEDIDRIYPEDYAPHGDTAPRRPRTWQALAGARDARPSPLGRAAVWLGQRMAFRQVPAWRGDGRILDVGCGGGGFLDTMMQLGWETHGCDPSVRACATARAKGHQVREGTAEDLDHPADSFDVVYLNHVLEHTFSPGRALRAIHRVLRPGGALFLAVPNYGGVQMRLLGRYSSALDPPRHLYQFERATLARYLAEAGFVDVELSTRTGSQSYTKAIRLMLNDLLGTAFRREPWWLSAPFAPLAFLGGLFGYFGAGRDLRATALK